MAGPEGPFFMTISGTSAAAMTARMDAMFAAVNDGGTAVYSSGSGTNTLTFT